MTKWKYRSCPRCSGDVYVEKDYEETYERCLQCGYINVSSSSSYGFEDAVERERESFDHLKHRVISNRG